MARPMNSKGGDVSKATGSKIHTLLIEAENTVREIKRVRDARANALEMTLRLFNILLREPSRLAPVLGLRDDEDDKVVLTLYKQLTADMRVPAGDLDKKLVAATTVNSTAIALKEALGMERDGDNGWYLDGAKVPNIWTFKNASPQLKSALKTARQWMVEESGSGSQQSSATLLSAMSNTLFGAMMSGSIHVSLTRPIGGTSDGPPALAVAFNIAKKAMSESRKHSDEKAAAKKFLEMVEMAKQDQTIGEDVKALIAKGASGGNMTNKMNRDLIVAFWCLLMQVYMIDETPSGPQLKHSMKDAEWLKDEQELGQFIKKACGVYYSANVGKSAVKTNLETIGVRHALLAGKLSMVDLLIHAPLFEMDAKRLGMSLSCFYTCPSVTSLNMLRVTDMPRAIKMLQKMVEIEKLDTSAKIHTSGYTCHRFIVWANKAMPGLNSSMLATIPDSVMFAFIRTSDRKFAVDLEFGDARSAGQQDRDSEDEPLDSGDEVM